MAAGIIVVPSLFPARDRNGRLVAGALMEVRTNRTTRKASIYADSDLTTPLPNPVTANGSGVFPIVWTEAGTVESLVLYTIAVSGPGGISIANPSVFHDWPPSLDADVALLAMALAAQISASADAEAAAQALAEIQDIAANAPDAPSVANKVNRTGDTMTGPLLIERAVGSPQPYAAIDQLEAVMIIGSIPDDPTKAAANAVIWQAAFDAIPAGKDGIVAIKTPGLHHLSGTVSQSGGRRITLVSISDATWTLGIPQVSAVVEQRASGPRQAYFASADEQYNTVGPVTETNAYGISEGSYGVRQNHRIYATVVPREDASFTADIADGLLAHWESLDGTFAFGTWKILVSPKTEDGEPWGVVGAEINVENRHADHGYQSTRLYGGSWCVLYQFVPEAQDFTDDGSTGYNILASIFFGQSSVDGASGYPARTYNAILSEPNAIAPGGRAIRFAGGNEGNGLNRDPHSFLQADENWTCGIDFTLATFRGQDGLGAGHAGRFRHGQFLAWRRSLDDALRVVFGVNYDETVICAAVNASGVTIGSESAGAAWMKVFENRLELPGFASWTSYANDAAAAAGGVALGSSYRNGSALCFRVS